MTSTVGLRVGAGQLMAAADHEVMRAQVRECLDDARDQGVDLLVLPEYSHYYDPRGCLLTRRNHLMARLCSC